MLNQTVKYISTLGVLPFCISLSSPTYADNGLGMTWAKQSHNNLLGVDRVGCYSSSGQCDTAQGDTKCATKLPILCLKKNDTPDPGVPIVPVPSGAMPDDYYNGWAEGHIGLTFPVRGDDLAGVADANDICEVQFGPGYRMGEFHDGKRQSGGYGGWNWYAYSNVDDSSRFWVYINDQSSNCWGHGPGTSSNRDEAEILALLLGSEPSGGECSQAELDAAYEKGYDKGNTDGYAKGAESCGTSNYPSPTYRFDSRKKTGILTLPTVDIQLMNPLFLGKWSTLYDAYSVVMELMPGTSGYFFITEVKEKQPSTDATSTQPDSVK